MRQMEPSKNMNAYKIVSLPVVIVELFFTYKYFQITTTGNVRKNVRVCYAFQNCRILCSAFTSFHKTIIPHRNEGLFYLTLKTTNIKYLYGYIQIDSCLFEKGCKGVWLNYKLINERQVKYLLHRFYVVKFYTFNKS